MSIKNKIYIEKSFSIPELKNISKKTIEEHLKLYAGYVKHTNLIHEKIESLSDEDVYTIGELRRRLGFEFDGMRNHEYYFEQFENGACDANKDSNLFKEIEKVWGSYDAWILEFKKLAMTRGVGWAFLYKDEENGNLLHAWIGEQQQGHLTGLKPLLVLDMWEHSYMLDVAPSEKKKYIDAFFENLNWSVCENRLK